MSTIREVRAVLSSDLANGPVTSELVQTVCSRLPMSAEDVSMVDLSLVEAVNNVVEHAYDFAPGKEIELALRVESDGLHIQVRDQGSVMPQALLERARAASRADLDLTDTMALPERGMGLMIIVRAMDDVSYEAAADGNVLALIKLFPKAPAAPQAAPEPETES